MQKTAPNSTEDHVAKFATVPEKFHAQLAKCRESAPQFQFFAFDQESDAALNAVMNMITCVALGASRLPRNPEFSAGLRKLMEAGDCFRRCASVQEKQGSPESEIAALLSALKSQGVDAKVVS